MKQVFQAHGRQFEVRAIQDVKEDSWKARVYENDKVVSPTYSVTNETDSDHLKVNGERAVKRLIEIAKSDIEEKLYI